MRTKTEPIFLYLSKVQKAYIKKVAEDEHTTVAQIIRDLIQRDMKEREDNGN